MKTALLFRENEEPIKVSADEVKNGLYSRYEEFVDLKYEFKVQYVNGARNNGGPYFRLYYSYEEYKKLYPERASRYEIVANMRRYEETRWHKEWKERVSAFCDIEKCIKNTSNNKRKFADAFYEKTQTCIEFQHSYIAWDFEERNKFYSELSINTIWLYDLPCANTRQNEDGAIEILEDNARGFFRISENPENLKNYCVYIQVKSGLIYRVNELFRRDSSTEQKSTIRYFVPSEIYTQQEFVEAIKSNTIAALSKNNIEVIESNTIIIVPKNNKAKNDKFPKSLYALWNEKYLWMIVKNVENGDLIRINHNGVGDMFRDYRTGCIQYQYVDDQYGNQPWGRKKEYSVSRYNERREIWIWVNAKNKTDE